MKLKVRFLEASIRGRRLLEGRHGSSASEETSRPYIMFCYDHKFLTNQVGYINN